jgi:plasmid stabilization system protein ParE
MTAFEVLFTRQATAAFDETFEWYRGRSYAAARKWTDAIELAIDCLERNPLRCPRAREHGLLPLQLRQYSFGAGRKRTHRMVFVVRQQTVVVYAIRHLAQDALSLDDLIGSE